MSNENGKQAQAKQDLSSWLSDVYSKDIDIDVDNVGLEIHAKEEGRSIFGLIEIAKWADYHGYGMYVYADMSADSRPCIGIIIN